MRVHPVPCLSDNYAYILVCERSGGAVVVDPGEAEPVLREVRALGLTVGAIWCTHHHPDHVGGNEGLAAALGVSEIAGHLSDRGRIPGLSRALSAGDELSVGELRARVMHVPGHTLGAVAYVVTGGGESCVFTGDTMFVAGCGRLFEGTAAQMWGSLSALAALPEGTKVYCGHEYTEANLRFAAHVEPENAHVAAAQARAKEARAAGRPTVPSTIGEERRSSPFLRASSAELRARLEVPAGANDATAFAAIRAAKDVFRG